MIYVFKTSVRTKTQVKMLEQRLNEIVPDQKWNFDLQDCDKILRIDSDQSPVLKITALLKTHRFDCEELE